MAGHSQFKNIMHRKGRQDAQRAKIFTKLIREITTAARLGAADPNANPRLRAAMIAPVDALPPGWARAVAPDPERFERLCQGLPQWADAVGIPALAPAGPGAITDPAHERLVLVRLEPMAEGLRVVPSRLLRLAEPPAVAVPGA